MKNLLDEAIRTRRILVTCGTGGVGKTTLSAAIAFRAALLGKKTVVITIDPAKRLATSLGLDSLGDHPTDLTPALKAVYEKAKSLGLQLPDYFPAQFSGSLAAIIPDTRKTFECFVADLAPDAVVADRVLRNPIFQIFAKEFSGTNEYMALERLYALDGLRQYDCIILDTPPSRNTLAFLNAPKLLAQFFDEKLIRWLVLPANKIVAGGMRKAFSILEKLTGAGFMTHLFDFASALFDVRVNFTANLHHITELLESPEVGFLMVTTPTPETAPEVEHFIDSIREHHFHFDGVALNRTLGYLTKEGTTANESPNHLKSDVELSGDFKAARAVVLGLQERERKVLAHLHSVIASVPELARDVHSVEDLFYVACALHGALGAGDHEPS